ncbi:MAG: polysaccharide deacetylase family protein [Patescibacteria group bacterium]|nr:polysaccharide deacetylase family protein [Patescibacteria group bacterium]
MKKVLTGLIMLASILAVTDVSLTFYFQKLAYSAVQDLGTKTVDTAAKPAPESRQAHFPILVFHHIRDYQPSDTKNDRTFIIPPADFEKQLKYLSDNDYSFITISQLADYLAGGNDLPPKPIAITFDDGDVNQYTNAFLILKKYNIIATFYIFVNPIGVSKNYLTWEEVKAMSDAGMEIGSHGWYHLFLDKLSDGQELAEIDQEIVKSQAIIEQQLGRPVVSFGYPFGTYNDDVVARIKAAGYNSARGIVNGKTHRSDSLFNLKAYFITADFDRFINLVK